MMKKLKKVLALLLAMSLVMSMATMAALAEEGESPEEVQTAVEENLLEDTRESVEEVESPGLPTEENKEDEDEQEPPSVKEGEEEKKENDGEEETDPIVGGDSESDAVCTQNEGCTAEEHDPDCPKYEAENPPEEPEVVTGIWFKMAWELNLGNGTLTYTPNPSVDDPKYNEALAYTPAGVIADLQPYVDQIQRIVIEKGITKLSQNSFKGLTGVESVELPDTVTEIGYCAFQGCSSLGSITIPASVTTINNGFKDCTALETVVLPDTMETVPTFAGCTALKEINIPANAQTIPANVFAGCTSLTQIDIPNTVTEIGNNTFKSSGLTFVEIPDSVTKIGEYAFSRCKDLAEVKLSKNESFTTIPKAAFEYCTSLKQIDIPDNITTFGRYAFQGSGLESIVIPKSVTDLSGGLVFLACYDLKSVVIEEGATTPLSGGAAFYACGNLTSVTLPSTLTEIGADTFNNDEGRVDGNGELVIMQLPILEIPDSVTTIGVRAFAHNDKLSIVCSRSVLAVLGSENEAQAKTVYVIGGADEPVSAIQDCKVFMLNGGTVTADALDVPTKEGSIFAGWYEAADFSGERVADDAAEAGKVYYARWCAEHVWDAGVVTTQPTYDSTGERTFTCTICGDTRTETIPARTRPSSGGSSGGATRPSATPTPTPTPVESQTPAPVETPVAVPESPEPAPEATPIPEEEELTEQETPLAQQPEELIPEASEEDLTDEEVPLADVPKTGDVLNLWLGLAAVSGFGLVWTGRRKEDEEG